MAGKAKSNYLSVVLRENHKTVLNKMFFNIGDLNKFIATDEFKELYPNEVYYIVKESY
jgi:hypothetical protein